MADVFISYSQQDREQVRFLAAFLEAEGYAVWWDTNLETADDFSEEILKQLELARAAIVVWTENSVGSQFVRAEAQIANQNKKIIPVKAKGVDYESLRPPFNVLHTEDLNNHEAILAAVKKQISKPPDAPPLWKQARYQLFSWGGIIGAGITLTTNVSSLIDLAVWIKLLLENWTWLLTGIWSFLFFRIDVNPADALALTFLLLITVNVCWAVRLKGRTKNRIVTVVLSAVALMVLVYASITGGRTIVKRGPSEIEAFRIQTFADIRDKADCSEILIPFAEQILDRWRNDKATEEDANKVLKVFEAEEKFREEDKLCFEQLGITGLEFAERIRQVHRFEVSTLAEESTYMKMLFFIMGNLKVLESSLGQFWLIIGVPAALIIVSYPLWPVILSLVLAPRFNHSLHFGILSARLWKIIAAAIVLVVLNYGLLYAEPWLKQAGFIV